MATHLSRMRFYYRLKSVLPKRVEFHIRQVRAQIFARLYRKQWPIHEKAGALPVGWNGWPEDKRFALVLTHDVEWQRGLDYCDKVSQIEEKQGLRSAFYFVPRRYDTPKTVREGLVSRGFEVGVHGLFHDGRLYSSREVFNDRAKEINRILKEWNACGFRSPAMHHSLDWVRELEIEYDASTFDTDPFQPQSDGLERVFPLWIPPKEDRAGYVEMPYTLTQDWKLFSILRRKNIDIWKKKVDWIAERGGMVLLITHPDYMNFGDRRRMYWDYDAQLYADFLEYVQNRYTGQFWHALPRDVARFWARYRHKEEDFKMWKRNGLLSQQPTMFGIKRTVVEV